MIEQSRSHITSDEKFDLEHNHSSQNPRVQRIKVPHKQHPVFAEAIRKPRILEIMSKLIGENIRFRNSKLNIKEANGGAAVDWHQDWAFYPHTNADLLAVGIMIDDIDGVSRTETMISLEESINDKKRLMHRIFNEL